MLLQCQYDTCPKSGWPVSYPMCSRCKSNPLGHKQSSPGVQQCNYKRKGVTNKCVDK